MSNTTSTPDLATPTQSSTPTPSVPANDVTTSAPITESPPITSTPIVISTTTPPPPPTTSSSIFVPPTTSSSSIPTSSTTTTPLPPTTTSAAPTTSRTPVVLTSVVTVPATNGGPSMSTIFITETQAPTSIPSSTRTTSSSRTSSTNNPIQATSIGPSRGGLNGGGKIAVAVVVPIVAVALLILGSLFFWRRRKQRKDAEELRRKEVEEYGFNPNNDPTLPAVGAAGVAAGSGTDGYEMKDGSSGYRGWGTTAVASSGRKASTTLSGPTAGGIGMAYSDTSPSHGPVSDTRSDNMMMDGRPLSPESEVLGAMGPSAANNRNGDINRGPSNASSSYSAANRSDGSGEGAAYGAGYNNQYDTGNPYQETAYGSPPARAEMSGQPVIRDVQARRNTRIENPSHFPQQSAGISQNF